ncbi:MAG TPA: RNA polymerase sigma factor [Aggregatilineales bacterium]|nr:RNA polymerase sigma factor [Aggregatilineales bacterium]
MDAQLASRAQQGDREAFLTLYNRYLTRVYNRVKSRIPNNDVDDVVQEIFITVMRSLKSFEQRSQFSTWLYTIVNRQIADFYRKRQRTINDDQTVSLDDIEQTLPSAVHSREKMDEQMLIKRAMAKLPEHYQEIIYLRLVDQYPFAEIATRRGQSLEAVKSLYRRAIQAIHEHVDVR